METIAKSAQGREILERFLSAMEARDEATLRALVDEDVVMQWPQSGERFRGIENAFGAVTATEGTPEMAGPPRIVGAEDVWVVMMPLRYGEDLYQYVGVFELAAGRIQQTTEYFGAPFPAQPGRARFAEP